MSEMSYHILLIDDDPDDIKLAEIQLGKINMDLNIDSVGSREAFQEYLKREPLPDLVICDYQLPDYNGEKALKFVRDLHDYVPFILLTGYLDEESAVELMRKGASDIITKQKLDRLGPAAQRELINFRERTETLQEQVVSARNNQLMLNNSEDSFIYINRELIIQSFNDRFATNYKNIFGVDVKQGDSILTYAKPERHDILKNIYKQVFEGEVIENELSFDDLNGNTRYFHIKYKPALDENKHIIGSFISLIEITEEKKAKLELEKNEARYRTLVENGSDVLFILNPEGQTKYISPSIKHVLGYSAEEAMQINMMDNAHPDDIEMMIGEINKCLNQPGVPLKVPPARLKDKDGHWHWFEGTITNMLHDPAIEGIVDNFHEITERVEAERKTVEAKNQYQSLIQTVDGIVWEADPETLVFNYVSPQAEKILGYSPEEWIGKKDFWQNKIHPEDRERAITFCSDQTDKGTNHTFEYRMRKADGGYIWFRDVVTVVNGQGGVVTLRGLMIDINQKKELELKLEQAYQLSKVGSWELDLVNEKLYWSKFIKDLHEVDDDFEPDIETAMNFYNDSSRETMDRAVEQAINRRESFDLELPIQTAKGNERWVRIVGRPEYVDEVCMRLYGSTQDITERKRAQIDRQEAEEKYRNVVEHSTNMFYQHDTKGVLTYVSPQSKQFLGYQPEEAIGDWTEFITDHPINKKGEMITQRAIETGEVQDRYELELRRADGRHIWVEVNEAPLKKEGEVVGIVGSLTDITERKELQDLLEQAQRMARFGVWELNLETEELYWSPVTREIHEAEPDFEPVLEEAVNFYKRGKNREIIQKAVHEAIENGTPWDKELQIVTAKGNEKWVRAKGEADFVNGKCVRLYGSFQDIHDRKVTEERMIEAYEQRQQILETTSEAYFALDRDYTVTYWNKACEELTDIPREEVLDYNLFKKRPETKKLKLFTDYQKEIQECTPVSFEEYNPEMDRWFDVHAYPTEKEISVFFRDISERKNAETEIKIINEKLNNAQETAKLGYWTFNIETGDVFWSDQLYRICEYDPETESANIDLILQRLHPDDRDYFLEMDKKVFKDDVPVSFEHRIVLPGGMVKWLHVTEKLTKSEEGKPVLLEGTVQDITEKKEAEQERVRILESISDAFFAINSDWNFTYFNQEAEHMLNRKAEDLLGNNLWAEFPEAKQTELYGIYKEVAETGTSRHFEYYYSPLEIWFDISAYPNDGGLSVFFRNINDRKRSEELINRINERFEKVTEATNDAIWDFDVVEGELFWGRGFDTLFGYDLEKTESSISFLLSLIHPDDRERVSEKIGSYLAPGGETDWFEEYRFRRSDGTYAYVMDRAVFIRNSNGEVTRVVGAMTDLTRQKEYEESLKTLNKDLEERASELAASNAELEQFAYVASHDLQEPLRMVSSFLTQLEKKYSDRLDEKALQYIDFAVDGANRMRQIILDLLNYSRLNKGQQEKTETDLNEVFKEVQALSRSRIEDSNAEIVVSELPTINVNPIGIKQVFQNLLSNALKYQNPGEVPKITLRAEELENHWKFSMEDNGIGINPEFKDTIFQIFQRLHTRDQYSGTGIGLSITKKIVERHGGDVWVESEEGQGSTFYFTIEK